MSIRELKDTLEQYRKNKVDPVEVRHVLMKCYGWIPEHEFYEECSIGDVIKLMKLIERDAKREKGEYDKMKRRSKSGGR